MPTKQPPIRGSSVLRPQCQGDALTFTKSACTTRFDARNQRAGRSHGVLNSASNALHFVCHAPYGSPHNAAGSGMIPSLVHLMIPSPGSSSDSLKFDREENQLPTA